MITYRGRPRYPDPEEFLYYEGRFFTVEWYYTEDGALPAWQYHQGLGEMDQERLERVVKHMADNPPGTPLASTRYRVEDAAHKIYAFKPGDERFFNFMTDGRKIIITNAYRKHSQEMTKADLRHLETAIKRRADYLERVREGVYYEDQA